MTDAAPPADRPDGAVIAGLVERVTFHNPDTGFAVLRVAARGERGVVTLVGRAAAIAPGAWITASGAWEENRTWGRQFRARFLKASAPTSEDGIRKYLGSGLVPGVGPVLAAKLVETFGAATFDVIDDAPDRLREVEGIGPKRAAQVAAAWAGQKAVREIMVFLHAHGIGAGRAARIYRTYGADAVEALSANPYRLARDIRGIGFRTADAIAMRVGIATTAPMRVQAGVAHALGEAMTEGHCGLPATELRTRAAELLAVPPDLVGTAVDAEQAAGTVVADRVGGTPCVFLAPLHRAERDAAARLRALAAGPPPWPRIDPGRALPWVERRTGLTLAPRQAEAVRQALTARVLVLTGGPGVGKTTIVNAILQILAAASVRIALCAPTGRAARRLGETTGQDARTIHRLLEVDPASGAFRRGAAHPLDCDLLVVDETSMVDVRLLQALLAAVPAHAGLLLVGDADQLPSVGPGQALADIIASDAIPVVRLTEVFRQAAHSRIIVNAHRVNAGLLPDLDRPAGASDFYFVRADDAEAAAARIRELVGARIPRRFGLDPIRDIQVLCPMNRGAAGARALNRGLQAALHPAGPQTLTHDGWTFGPGDKVMQLENDYDRDVYNGDVGAVDGVDPERGELTVRFDGQPAVYGPGDLDALAPAYAITIHKSQGSEYPAVVIPILTEHYVMLHRHLLYTGMTRGRRLVVLVGQPRAVAIAVRAAAGRRRWSKLGEWLAAPRGRADAP